MTGAPCRALRCLALLGALGLARRGPMPAPGLVAALASADAVPAEVPADAEAVPDDPPDPSSSSSSSSDDDASSSDDDGADEEDAATAGREDDNSAVKETRVWSRVETKDDVSAPVEDEAAAAEEVAAADVAPDNLFTPGEEAGTSDPSNGEGEEHGAAAEEDGTATAEAVPAVDATPDNLPRPGAKLPETTRTFHGQRGVTDDALAKEKGTASKESNATAQESNATAKENNATAKGDEDEDYEYVYDDDYDYEFNDRDTLFQNFHCSDLLYGHDAEIVDPVSDSRIRSLKQQWAQMREKYHEIAGANATAGAGQTCPQKRGGKASAGKSAKGVRGLLDAFAARRRAWARRARHALGRGVSSMRVPVRIGDAGPDKGRGVFATEAIPYGALVVDLDNGSTGFFKKRQAWRRLAESLPNETACNMLEWTFIQNLKPLNETDTDVRNGLTIFIAFDESNLMNNADWDEVTANIKCGSPPQEDGGAWGECRLHYYAARDIAPGEELLISYGEFEGADQQDWWDIADK